MEVIKQKIIKEDSQKVWLSLPFYARKNKETEKREIMVVHKKKDNTFLCYESGRNQFYSLDYLTEQGYEFFVNSPTYGEVCIDGLAWEKEYKVAKE